MKIKNYRTSYILAGIVILSLCTACSKQKIKEVNETPTISERSLVNSEVFENGFGYNSFVLDLFVLVKGENWRYEEKLQRTEFYQESEGSSNVMMITSTDMSRVNDNTWCDEWEKSMQAFSGYELLKKEETFIGQKEYIGRAYEYKMQTGEFGEGVIRYYLWSTGKRAYIFSAGALDSLSTDFLETITTAIDTFMTYDEFERAQNEETG